MRSAVRQVALLLCLAALIPVCTQAQVASQNSADLHPALFSIHSGEQQATPLNGLWRFRPGDDPAFADPAYDDSAWALLRSDKPWTEQGYENVTGFAWYRFRIQLPAGSASNTILLPVITSGYQCFIDGRLIHTEGAVQGQSPARHSLPAVMDFPPAVRPGPRTVTVALRVWYDSSLAGTLAGGPAGRSTRLTSIGESSSLREALADYFALRRQTEMVTLFLSMPFLLAGILCFLLFFLERTHKEYFWYGIAATSFGLQLWINFDWSTHAWPISTFFDLNTLSDAGTGIGLVLFFSYLLGYKRNWLTALILLACALPELADLLQAAGLIGDRADALLSCLGICVYAGWVIFAVAQRAGQRVLDAMLLVLPVTLDFGLLLLDSLRLEFPSLGESNESIADHMLVTDPFQIRVRNLDAAFVLLAFVSVLLIRFARIRRKHDRLMADLGAARSIQHLLIPKELPTIPGLKIEAAYHPAQEVGGDFFQVIPVTPSKTVIVLGDVSGKGLPAAMTVSLIVGIVRTLVQYTSAPSEILAGLNSRLVGRGTGFTTCLAMEIDQNGTLKFANAGQLAPYRNGVEIGSEAALPLGILPDLGFPELTVQLEPGDRLTLVTDGIPEAASHHELFGFERTEGLSQQSAAQIAEAARSFGQTDDITVLSIHFAGIQG